jgi:hypothetical protein
MMLYVSELLNAASQKQEFAETAVNGFSQEVQAAIALADHFECIQPEEYVLPMRAQLVNRSEHVAPQSFHTAYTHL